jgi:hypothetical protein
LAPCRHERGVLDGIARRGVAMLFRPLPRRADRAKTDISRPRHWPSRSLGRPASREVAERGEAVRSPESQRGGAVIEELTARLLSPQSCRRITIRRVANASLSRRCPGAPRSIRYDVTVERDGSAEGVRLHVGAAAASTPTSSTQLDDGGRDPRRLNEVRQPSNVTREQWPCVVFVRPYGPCRGPLSPGFDGADPPAHLGSMPLASRWSRWPARE